MTIKLYKIKDDRRRLEKTLNAETLQRTMTGHLKSDCSILDPIIEITYDPVIVGCNYMYIEEFERYYHITNIEVGSQRAFIHAHVDVLQTYALQIRQLDCIVERQESRDHSNLYLNDGMFRALNYKIISTVEFPKTPFMNGKQNVDSLILTVGGGY